MVQRYIEAVRDAVMGTLGWATQWEIPLAALLGLAFAGCVAVQLFGRDRDDLQWLSPRSLAVRVLGYGVVGTLLVGSYGGLKATKPGAQSAFRHLDRAEATSNALPDAPVVVQSGPAVAALSERTYNSSLTLPPSFLGRLNGEGLDVLAPYLADQSTQNVIRLRNQFKRQGRSVVFSRQATVLEEKPIALSDSQVKVTFNRLSKRAYDAQFEAHYRFGNSGPKATQVHFLFSLPEAGTVRDLRVFVGKQSLTEPATSTPPAANGNDEEAKPSDPNTYEWKGTLAPNETREAVVSYRVVGARVWSYDLGSTRRRVEQFQLDANTNGDVGFARGSLQPSTRDGANVRWQLSNVITAQQLSLVFPSDEGARQLYFQSLSALPASLLLFFLAVVAGKAWLNLSVSPVRLGAALVLFALGLGAATVSPLSSWPVVSLLVCPLVGATLGALLLGRRALLVALPIALLPATFLSANYSGLLVLLLIALSLGVGGVDYRVRRRS